MGEDCEYSEVDENRTYFHSVRAHFFSVSRTSVDLVHTANAAHQVLLGIGTVNAQDLGAGNTRIHFESDSSSIHKCALRVFPLHYRFLQ